MDTGWLPVGASPRRKVNPPAYHCAEIDYYVRARGLGIRDPLLDMSLGIAYLHRAMQRQADNRHILILQGMTFLFQYHRDTVTKSAKYTPVQAANIHQEADYNIARAFHQLGLVTFATAYYERVLRTHEEWKGQLKYDLSFEAAHNLCLIYSLSGNYEATREVTEKYLLL